MKKILIVSSIIVMAMFNSCGTGSKKVVTEMDSVAYGIGMDLGNYIKQLDPDLNVDMIAQAMKDVLKDTTQIESENMQQFLQEYFMVRKPAKAKIASEEFLAQVEKDNKNVKKTESGLLYEVLVEGGEKATNDADTVEVNYLGTLKDGTKFDSSYDRGQTATFPLNGVIKGWTEGMKLVGKGGKIKLWIPSDLGYGTQGGGPIGANEALIFEVELVDVKPVAVIAE